MISLSHQLTAQARAMRLVLCASLALLLAPVGALGKNAEAVLSADSQACLGCHGEAGMEKVLADGKLQLQVKAKPFAASVHNAVSCTGCHTDVDMAKHSPAPGKSKQTLREYTLAKLEACRMCHEDKFKLYEGSIHAALGRSGNTMAPVCGDCHEVHAVKPKAAVKLAEVPCRNCHGDVFDAYAQSVHGAARAKDAAGGAPLCAECHRSHDVAPAAGNTQMKETCLGCHADALALHKRWLPNAAHHFEAVSCAACHAPKAARRVDLKLYDVSAKERIVEKKGVPHLDSLVKIADAEGKGLNEQAVQNLLKQFNANNAEGDTILRGRLEVDGGAATHLLANKEQAIRDCNTCHREGAGAFQKVSISIIGADGRQTSFGAQKDVLQAPTSVNSVRGFYAIGSTRILSLDILFVLTLAAGIGIPIGHLSLKWLSRRNRTHAAQAGEEKKNA